MGNLKPETKGRFIVIVACGWARMPRDKNDYGALCQSVVQRLSAALKSIRPGDRIGVTGDVPYDAAFDPEATLASCMRAWLLSKGVTNHIVKLEGLNAFSESLLTVQLANDLGFKELVIYSSDFYLKAYDRMWKAWARRSGIDIQVVSVESGDWVSTEVRDFYGKPFGKAMLLARFASLATPFGHFARRLADSKTQDRIDVGFRLSGCTGKMD